MDPQRIFKLTDLVACVISPIYTAGIIHAVAERGRGRRVGYREAIAVGLRTWGRLLAARFVAGLFILLGLVAFVVPGVVLLVRYALLSPVVVLEGETGPGARRRSAELARGRRWQIVGAAALFFGPYVAAYSGAYALLGQFPTLDNLWLATAVDCILDVSIALLVIVMYLIYREARSLEDGWGGDAGRGGAGA